MKEYNKAKYLILFTFFLFIPQVKANSIKNIDMDVFVEKNGDASVTETWKTTSNEGTEIYRGYATKSYSISNFTVSDDLGRNYEFLSDWDISGSFSDKAYKNGINYNDDGIELCWGISQYGNRTYTLKYNISNLVKQYTDNQGIYFNFLSSIKAVDSVKITIHSDESFSLDNAKIWDFGNNGEINFKDGKIVLTAKNLTESQYIVGLVRFEHNIFNISNITSESFDDVYDSAMSDVKDIEKPFEIKDIFLLLVAAIFFNPILWIVLLMIFINKFNKKSEKLTEFILGSRKRSGDLDFGLDGNVLPEDVNYYREIPSNKDLERAYWVCLKYFVIPEEKVKQGIIGAILLKWIKNGYITVLKMEKGILSFKDNNYAIDLTKITNVDNEIENGLLKILITAAGPNKILEAKEFKKWSKKNYSEVSSWFSSIDDQVELNLEKEGLITLTQETTQGMFGTSKNITIKNVNPKLKEEAAQLKGLKKFLLDFSIMPEREYFEVKTWEEYLIFAQLMGIADKVAEQFSKIYPNFNQESLLNSDFATLAVINMADLGYTGMVQGYEIANSRSSEDHDYSGSSRSSGSGGSSYSSGGSSAEGSSGGGFR